MLPMHRDASEAAAREFESAMGSEADWELAKSTEAVRLFVRPDPGARVAIKACGVVGMTPSQTYEAIKQTQSWAQDPSLEIREVESYDATHDLIYASANFLCPIARRDALLLRRSTFDPVTGQGLVVVCSTEHDEKDNACAECVRASVLPSGVRIAPFGQGGRSTYVSMVVNVDLGGTVPDVVRDFCSEAVVEALGGLERLASGTRWEPKYVLPYTPGAYREAGASWAQLEAEALQDVVLALSGEATQGFTHTRRGEGVEVLMRQTQRGRVAVVRGQFVLESSVSTVYDTLTSLPTRAAWQLYSANAQALEEVSPSARVLHETVHPLLGRTDCDSVVLQSVHESGASVVLVETSVEHERAARGPGMTRGTMWPSGVVLHPVGRTSCLMAFVVQYLVDSWFATPEQVPSPAELGEMLCRRFNHAQVSLRQALLLQHMSVLDQKPQEQEQLLSQYRQLRAMLDAKSSSPPSGAAATPPVSPPSPAPRKPEPRAVQLLASADLTVPPAVFKDPALASPSGSEVVSPAATMEQLQARLHQRRRSTGMLTTPWLESLELLEKFVNLAVQQRSEIDDLSEQLRSHGGDAVWQPQAPAQQQQQQQQQQPRRSPSPSPPPVSYSSLMPMGLGLGPPSFMPPPPQQQQPLPSRSSAAVAAPAPLRVSDEEAEEEGDDTAGNPLHKRARRPNDSRRVCSNCGTTDTPKWRKANDDRTLCNACGLQRNKTKGRRKRVVVRAPAPAAAAVAAPVAAAAAVAAAPQPQISLRQRIAISSLLDTTMDDAPSDLPSISALHSAITSDSSDHQLLALNQALGRRGSL